MLRRGRVGLETRLLDATLLCPLPGIAQKVFRLAGSSIFGFDGYNFTGSDMGAACNPVSIFETTNKGPFVVVSLTLRTLLQRGPCFYRVIPGGKSHPPCVDRVKYSPPAVPCLLLSIANIAQHDLGLSVRLLFHHEKEGTRPRVTETAVLVFTNAIYKSLSHLSPA